MRAIARAGFAPCLLFAFAVVSAVTMSAVAARDVPPSVVATGAALSASAWGALAAWVLARDRSLAALDWERFERAFWAHVAATRHC